MQIILVINQNSRGGKTTLKRLTNTIKYFSENKL